MICSEFCFEDDGGGCGDGGSVGGSCGGGDGGNVIVVVGKRRPLQLVILTLKFSNPTHNSCHYHHLSVKIDCRGLLLPTTTTNIPTSPPPPQPPILPPSPQPPPSSSKQNSPQIIHLNIAFLQLLQLPP